MVLEDRGPSLDYDQRSGDGLEKFRLLSHCKLHTGGNECAVNTPPSGCIDYDRIPECCSAGEL